MASSIKNCRVCGKEYKCCNSYARKVGIFRWQDVACCPDHGAIYLAEIMESRKPVDTTTVEVESASEDEVVKDVDIDDEDEDDYDFFDDEEDTTD